MDLLKFALAQRFFLRFLYLKKAGPELNVYFCPTGLLTKLTVRTGASHSPGACPPRKNPGLLQRELTKVAILSSS